MFAMIIHFHLEDQIYQKFHSCFEMHERCFQFVSIKLTRAEILTKSRSQLVEIYRLIYDDEIRL